MARISRTRGKMAELGVARVLGTTRAHFERHDLNHPVYGVEVKHRKQLPALLKKWFTQAEEACPRGKLPLLVLHEERIPYEECLCVLKLKNLK